MLASSWSRPAPGPSIVPPDFPSSNSSSSFSLHATKPRVRDFPFFMGFYPQNPELFPQEHRSLGAEHSSLSSFPPSRSSPSVTRLQQKVGRGSFVALKSTNERSINRNPFPDTKTRRQQSPRCPGAVCLAVQLAARIRLCAARLCSSTSPACLLGSETTRRHGLLLEVSLFSLRPSLLADPAGFEGKALLLASCEGTALLLPAALSAPAVLGHFQHPALQIPIHTLHGCLTWYFTKSRENALVLDQKWEFPVRQPLNNIPACTTGPVPCAGPRRSPRPNTTSPSLPGEALELL